MIEITQLSKEFKLFKKAPGLWGSVKGLVHREWEVKEALSQVTLNVGQGELVGLLGSNGAGKTTLVKVCTGIVHATNGSVRVLGQDPWRRKDSFKRQIALIMGQKAQLWWDLPASDCFMLLREIYQIPEEQFQQRLSELCEILELNDLLTTQIRRLSLGERMKMELVAALLHNPKVIFLDEPTIGLDIASQRALRKFILDYHRRFRPTIVLTSHYMEDIESLCERIIILREGQIVFDDTLANLRHTYAGEKILTFTLDADASIEWQRWTGLADIDRSLSNDWGRIGTKASEQIQLHVQREHVQIISRAMLAHLKVADFHIKDDDVASIISNIQTGSRA